MFWIALCPTTEADRHAWTWWALRFTPRVTHVDEAVLIEVSGSLKLFGGRKALLHLLLRSHADLGDVPWAAGPTSLVALALLRCKQHGIAKPARLPDDLPLELLTAALPHVALLERTGTRTWGQVRAMPRGGQARRFGADFLAALDAAFGDRPETYSWQLLPEHFDLNAELASV